MTRKEKFLKAINGKEIYYFDHEGNLKINGYFYCAGDSCTDNPKQTWRHVELCWCYPDMTVFAEDPATAIDQAESECKQYISDLTPEEVLQMFASYFRGKPPVPAPMVLKDFERLSKENAAYIDVKSLPPFPLEDCANNPDIGNEIL